jgi:hypothetical protein
MSMKTIELVQLLAAGKSFSLGTLVSFTNKSDCYDLIKISLKMELNTITLG